jgi:hypothetical protein
MFMQPGNINISVGIDTCSLEMDMKSGHGNEAWTWTCSVDMNMQREHGHAAWTWTCSVDIDM